MRYAVVWNPQSRGGKLAKQWGAVSTALRRNLGEFEELRTEDVGHATNLTRAAVSAGADMVVVVGGDGTINEVVNGFYQGEAPINRDTHLGILPFGTGGDFRRTLGMPEDLEKACEVLRAGRSKNIDLGRIKFTARNGDWVSRYFINIASCGISGVVDRLINESRKKLGRISFFTKTLRAAMSYDNKRVQVILDRKSDEPIELTINTLAVANGRYFGGAMMIAPEAELGDGKFDVVALGDFTMGEMLFLSRKIYKGTHLAHEKVSMRRASHVEVLPLSDNVELDIDGEAPGILPAQFEIVPGGISIIVP